MTKFRKALLAVILGTMTMSGCEFTNFSDVVKPSTGVSSSTSENTSSSTTSDVLTGDALILDELVARVTIPQAGQEVINNFQLPATVKYGEYTGTITWTADNGALLIDTIVQTVTDANTGATREVYNVIVLRPEYSKENDTTANVKLTATVSYSSLTGSKNFRVIVPESDPSTEDAWGTSEGLEISSWSEWIAQPTGKIAVKGIITGMVYQAQYSNANVFLQDADGGYYAYAVGEMSEEQANNYLAVGNEVIFEGEKSIYNGLHEFNQEKTTSIQVLSRGNTVAPTDVTEAATKGELTRYQSMWVEATGIFVQDGGKYYFQFGDYKYEMYHSNKYSGSYFDVVEEQLKGIEVGNTVKVRGFVGCYNADQFHPYNIEKVEGVVLTPEQKVDINLGSAESVFTNYKGTVINTKTEIALHTSDEVTISYSLDNNADTSVYNLTSDKLTVTPATETKNATLTITVSCGDVTKTATVELSACAAIEYISLTEALEIASSKGHNEYTTEKYYIKATVKDVYNTQFGNMHVTDGTNELTIYGTYSADGKLRYDAMESKPVAGDEVVLYGILGQYNGTAQMKNAWIQSFTTPDKPVEPDTPVVPEGPKTVTLAEAAAIGAAQAHNTYTSEYYYISGTITEVYNTQYGNMYITDGTTTFTVYGLLSADGTVRYDAMETKPVVGDEIKVYGTLGQYNGTAQMKNGWLVEHKPATPSTPDTPDTPEEPGINIISLAEAAAIGAAKEHNTYTTEKYYVKGMITEVYNTQYGNMYITDGTTTFTVYGLLSADGTVRYDSMTNKPDAGDEVIVYGVLGQYSGTAQMKNGWLISYTEGELPEPEEPETPEVTAKATFTFGENKNTTTHADGSIINAGKTYTDGNYTLKIDSTSGTYGSANDAKGNSALKMGTSKNTGYIEFTVPEDVTTVVVYIAGYKANAACVKINGTTYNVNAKSNNGEYEAIVIDTSSTKTVKIETTSSQKRAMIDTIVFA